MDVYKKYDVILVSRLAQNILRHPPAPKAKLGTPRHATEVAVLQQDHKQGWMAAPKAGTVETSRHSRTQSGHEKHVGYTPTSEWLPLSREALLTITGVVVGGLQVSTVNEALTLAAVRTETLKVHTH